MQWALHEHRQCGCRVGRAAERERHPSWARGGWVAAAQGPGASSHAPGPAHRAGVRSSRLPEGHVRTNLRSLTPAGCEQPGKSSRRGQHLAQGETEESFRKWSQDSVKRPMGEAHEASVECSRELYMHTHKGHWTHSRNVIMESTIQQFQKFCAQIIFECRQPQLPGCEVTRAAHGSDGTGAWMVRGGSDGPVSQMERTGQVRGPTGRPG